MKQSNEWLAKMLPPVERIWRRSEPDFYGASYLIAHSLGRKKVPVSFAAWRHGWTYYEPIIHPRLISNGAPNMTSLVATKEQVRILNNFGYNKVHSVGLPYIYGDSIRTERKPDSLLVMPAHTLPYTDNKINQEAYVDSIANLRPQFTSIIACLHSSCVEKGYWCQEFEKYGIPWITGADTYDKNALVRMNLIFNSVEYMTTNRIGSHVAYAAYSGCKVSIYGDYASPHPGEYKNDPFWKTHADLLQFWIEQSSLYAVRQKYPGFFVHPRAASIRKKWAAEAVGVENQRSPDEIARLLGWSLSDQISGYTKEGYRLLSSPRALRQLLNRRRLAK